MKKSQQNGSFAKKVPEVERNGEEKDAVLKSRNLEVAFYQPLTQIILRNCWFLEEILFSSNPIHNSISWVTYKREGKWKEGRRWLLPFRLFCSPVAAVTQTYNTREENGILAAQELNEKRIKEGNHLKWSPFPRLNHYGYYSP